MIYLNVSGLQKKCFSVSGDCLLVERRPAFSSWTDGKLTNAKKETISPKKLIKQYVRKNERICPKAELQITTKRYNYRS